MEKVGEVAIVGMTLVPIGAASAIRSLKLSKVGGGSGSFRSPATRAMSFRTSIPFTARGPMTPNAGRTAQGAAHKVSTANTCCARGK